MKRAIFAAVALGFATTMAYAQTETTPAPASPADQPQASSPSPHGPDMHGPDMRGPDGMRGPGRHGPDRWQKHRGMMMGSKAAHFSIRDGDVMINVKCADDDTTAACGRTVMQLLDRLQAGQSTDDDQGGDDPTMNE
jgi:hypothetical protein